MKTIDIKGKAYVTVSERVKAIRNKYGFNVSIITEVVELDGESVSIKATVLQDGNIIATGHAKENKNDSFINKGSYVENCETSAVGRALAFAGFGIDAEIASADEIVNSDSNAAISSSQMIQIENLLQSSSVGETIQEKIQTEMEDMTYSRASDCIEYLKNNQLDPVEAGANYNQTDIQKKLDQKV
jgi:hypothetical protein